MLASIEAGLWIVIVPDTFHPLSVLVTATGTA